MAKQTMNKLPHSWAVFNDGSEEFQEVAEFLFPYTAVFGHYKRLLGWYFGISKDNEPIYCLCKDDFDTILSIKQFKDSIQ